jgi:coenzyme F420 hydrogenase subunit beta
VVCCPADELPSDAISIEQLQSAKGLFLGNAADEQVRFMGSTGGVARTLLMSLLAGNKVDAVYSLYSSDNADEEAEGRYFTKAPVCDRIPSSLYRPVLWGKGVLDIQLLWKKIALIGLPCQIKSSKKLIAKKFPELEVYAVALICRQQKTIHYTEYVKQILNAPQAGNEQVTYRGQGWPGKLGVIGKTGISKSFMASGEAFGNNLWRVPGCKYCPDCLGATVADMTLADPWNHISETDDPVGTNLIMVWSNTGMRLLEQSHAMLERRIIGREAVEKILSFNIIGNKKNEIACRLGKQKNSMKLMRFWLIEKKIRLLEKILLSNIHDSVFAKVLCKLLKRLG